MALATRSKPPAHYKKRQAQHHRRTRRYMKPYWPYLPMLLIVVVGLAVNSLWSGPPKVLGVNTDFSDARLLAATNQDRTDAQQAPLTLDSQLDAAAQAKANDMAAHNYWAHNAPDGKTPWTFIAASGYQYQAAGENLAYGFSSAGDTITGWMNSSEHRDNMLSASYQNVGFGIAQSPNYQGQGPATIVVAEYGQPVAAAATITFKIPNTAANTVAHKVRGANTELAAKPVSRIQIMTGGQAAWATLAVGALAGAALALFITRHSLRFHRAFIRGERFISHHPLVDIVATFVFTAGFILTRTSGLIR